MNVDSGVHAQIRDSRDIWKLPEILDLKIRARSFDPPRRVTTQGVDREVREGVEVEIHVSEPFPIRAVGPVLWVGGAPLTIAESDGKTTYRFFSFQPESLKADVPVSLSWNTPGSPKKTTAFRYQAPSK
jgi:hypothetical protein